MQDEYSSYRNASTSTLILMSRSFLYHPLVFVSALVHAENTLLGFLTYSAVDALRCIELARGEFLLVFHTLAVYVDSQGRKSRDREIMYPAVPTAVSKCIFLIRPDCESYVSYRGFFSHSSRLWYSGYCEGYLLVYSETHIDVFDCTSGDWLQTLNVKRARPLNISGSLTSCVINDMPYVIYLSNLHQRKYTYIYVSYKRTNHSICLRFIYISFVIGIVGLINRLGRLSFNDALYILR